MRKPVDPLLLLGASTRAVAQSAVRAGFSPIAGDLFADLDLRAIARMVEVPEYPQGLFQALDELPPTPWMYTGALENWPKEVAAVSEKHPLLGNSAAVLRACRDPARVQDVLLSGGLPMLRIIPCDQSGALSQMNVPVEWMLKPVRSAAGRGVRRWSLGETFPDLSEDEQWYLQEFHEGDNLSAACLSSPWGTVLLGISRQIVGRASPLAPAYGYCGSVVGEHFLPNMTEQVEQIAEVFGKEFELRGLWGFDFVWSDKQPWVVEINPRYTASMELWEALWAVPLIAWHREACLGHAIGWQQLVKEIQQLKRDLPNRILGKRIIYADQPAIAPDWSSRVPHRFVLGELPEVADIPMPGSPIEPGQPVFTWLGELSSRNGSETLREINQRAHRVWEEFLSGESPQK